jgi:hypothetical protein
VLEASQLKLSVRYYGSWWHLRSPGYSDHTTASVVGDGQINPVGMINAADALRPALYLKLTSPVLSSKNIENVGATIKNPTVTDANGYTWDIVGVNYGAVKRGVDTPSGNATLLLSNESKKKFNYSDVDKEIFNGNDSGSNVYSGSDLQAAMNRASNAISGTEYIGKITPRNIVGGSKNYGNAGYNSDIVAGDSVGNQKTWSLSVKEAEDLQLQQRVFGYTWLLRSPGASNGANATVGYTGGISPGGAAGGNALRPALYLNLSSSIFQSLDADWINNFVDYSQDGWGKSAIKVPLSKISVSPLANKTYTGKSITPVVKATYNSATLILGTDYSVSYSKNTNAGNASVTLTGKGKYSGTKVVNFTILPAPVSKLSVAGIKDQVYNGKVKKPVLAIKHGSLALKLNTHYTVKHSTRKAVGKATITIKGKGNYTGTKAVTFRILPAKTSVSKLTVGKKQIIATWKKVSGTTKYEVRYRVKGTSKWTTKSVSGKSSSLKITKLKKNKTYQVQVRSYKTVSKVKYCSAWSATKTSKKVK